MKDYAIAGGLSGKERLDVLSAAMNSNSMEVLRRAGLKQSHSVIDIGCGGGNMCFDLVEAVGQDGRVCGIDYDGEIIRLAEEKAADLNLSNLEFRKLSIYELAEHEQYDIVYSRYLLSHLSDPSKALGIMAQALKPGGYVVLEDIYFSGHFCYPANPAFERYQQWYREVVRKKGGDADIGARLPLLLKNAGLTDIRLHIVQPAGLEGPAKELSLITLDRIKNALLNEQITDTEGFDSVYRELEAFTFKQDSLISMAQTFQVWGRKA